MPDSFASPTAGRHWSNKPANWSGPNIFPFATKQPTSTGWTAFSVSIAMKPDSGAAPLKWEMAKSTPSSPTSPSMARSPPASKNQAFSALLFLFREVLQTEFEVNAVRAKRLQRLPVSLSVEEVRRLLERLPPGHDVFARRLYSAG